MSHSGKSSSARSVAASLRTKRSTDDAESAISSNAVTSVAATPTAIASSASASASSASRSPVGSRFLFVTVGTTRFDSLITTLNAEAEALVDWLIEQGFSRVLLQIGTGIVEPLRLKQVAEKKCAELASSSSASGSPSPTLSIDWLRHSPDLLQFISRSDLVISHAGAGSILESLRLFRPLLVVINTGLMHNHQLEVAEALERGKFLYQTEPQWVMQVLKTANWTPPIEARETGASTTKVTSTASASLSSSSSSSSTADAASLKAEAEAESTAVTSGSQPPLHHYQLLRYPPVQADAFPQLLEEHVEQILRPTSATARAAPWLITTVIPALLAFAITWAIVQ